VAPLGAVIKTKSSNRVGVLFAWRRAGYLESRRIKKKLPLDVIVVAQPLINLHRRADQEFRIRAL
jgi:hypothetical protein